jgi:hypothetical protein
VDHFDCLRTNDRCLRGWEATFTALSAIRQFLADQGVPLVLVHIPVVDEINYNSKRPPYEIRKVSDKLHEFSATLGFPLVDLADCDGLTADDYYAVDGHWNARGHAAATTCIHEAIAQGSLLKLSQ